MSYFVACAFECDFVLYNKFYVILCVLLNCLLACIVAWPYYSLCAGVLFMFERNGFAYNP